jgi:hypothetical protein
MPKSVTYVSGINCHPSIRKGSISESVAGAFRIHLGLSSLKRAPEYGIDIERSPYGDRTTRI